MLNLQDETLKDVDLENMLRTNFLKININEELKDLITETLKRDIDFLQTSGFMDYSLLLGVERVQPKQMRSMSE